jgi:hypothetical protein
MRAQQTPSWSSWKWHWLWSINSMCNHNAIFFNVVWLFGWKEINLQMVLTFKLWMWDHWFWLSIIYIIFNFFTKYFLEWFKIAIPFQCELHIHWNFWWLLNCISKLIRQCVNDLLYKLGDISFSCMHIGY